MGQVAERDLVSGFGCDCTRRSRLHRQPFKTIAAVLGMTVIRWWTRGAAHVRPAGADANSTDFTLVTARHIAGLIDESEVPEVRVAERQGQLRVTAATAARLQDSVALFAAQNGGAWGDLQDDASR